MNEALVPVHPLFLIVARRFSAAPAAWVARVPRIDEVGVLVHDRAYHLVGDQRVVVRAGVFSRTVFDQGGHELDAQAPGETVVAGSGLAQRLGAGALPQ
ncbi:hypothetical protein [Microtetraspora sp. NBRC 13810]|uniref:hypothetical protein n=1 Tax=Microtetraspora sp. NBRC 13810 TaxID=3030990 RepID=UPI0025542512|nr:hypothetical protein [Microtetraspora sp. NBRC 13810]